MTVVTASKGLKVRFAAIPAAITTIIVSPMARETASNIAPTIPGRAAGKTIFFTVSDFVAPIAYEPSLNDCGTAVITSSDQEEINGMIIIPITPPAAIALSAAMLKPSKEAKSLKNGPTVMAAKNP